MGSIPPGVVMNCNRKHEKRLSSHQRTKGFTFIEIIIALGILTIGLITILAVFPVGLDVGRKSQNYTDAALLASYKMADIMYNLDNSIAIDTYGPTTFSTNNAFSWYYSLTEVTAQSLYRIDLAIYSLQSTTEPLYRTTSYIKSKE
ncbi:prepilin-type N-terminal cleavage/methylation domain-containing protein [Chlamydiota bacterium]